MSPLTLSAMNAMIAIRPIRVTQTSGLVKSPSATSVAGFGDDDAVDQADERDEQADADADRALEVRAGWRS